MTGLAFFWLLVDVVLTGVALFYQNAVQAGGFLKSGSI